MPGSWGEAGKDGLKGAALGSVLGPWGAAAGGVLGAGYGALYGDDGSNKGTTLPYFQDDRNRLGGLLQGQSPFAGQEWGSLVSQLQGRANGTNNQVAVGQYQTGIQDASNNLSAMSHGGVRAGSFRSAADQQGNLMQGMAAGSQLAKTQDMQSAQQSLQGALGSRDALNSGAYQNILGQQLGLSQQNVNAQLGIQTQNNQQTAANYQALGTTLNTLGALQNQNNNPKPGGTPGVTMSGGSGTYYSPH